MGENAEAKELSDAGGGEAIRPAEPVNNFPRFFNLCFLKLQILKLDIKNLKWMGPARAGRREDCLPGAKTAIFD